MGGEGPMKSGEANFCRLCGECLVRCRYLGYSRKKAVSEMRKLRDGEDSEVLVKCMGCHACDAFCPYGAEPCAVILGAWRSRRVKTGVPARAEYLLPFSSPNFRRDLPFSAEEKALHQKWASLDPPAETVLYPGCNLLAMPLLAVGPIFDRLPVWGSFDLCCSEMYYRMGLFDVSRSAAGRLSAFYAGRNLKDMVFVCPACANMFKNVLPKKFGAKFDFKITHFADWFSDRLVSGVLLLARPLSVRVVIHDSCHARLLGAGFMERQRNLLKRLGLAVFETPGGHGAEGLCCGMAAGCAGFSGLDIARQALRAIRALSLSPADKAVTYCGGCLLAFETVRAATPTGKPVFHTLELVGAAMGEDPCHPGPEKGRALLSGILANAVPRYLSRRRIFPQAPS
jgi:Fe-S oxidoreductase